MSPLISIMIVLAMVYLLGMSLYLMYRNLSDIYKMNMGTPKVRLSHPELDEVEEGDELLVVKFKPELDAEGTVDLQFTPDRALEDRMLNKALENRIAELEDEDDDDDGDIPARLTPLR